MAPAHLRVGGLCLSFGAMAEVVVYTGILCPFCERAKRLLRAKGVAFREIDVSDDAARRAEMEALCGARTVPQVVIDGEPVGGCDELHALERDGLLDARLGEAA